jgi:RHS repeat-associated protein
LGTENGNTRIKPLRADGGNVVLDFVDPDGSGAQAIAMSKRYLWGEAVDQLFAQEDLSKTLGDAARNLWPLVDHLGTVRDLAKQDGTIATHYTYDSFGNVKSGDTSQTRYLFTSREFDTATKLQYNRARYYDAAVGRWISEDPKGFVAGDVNDQRYVGNRVVFATDPSGRQRDLDPDEEQRLIELRDKYNEFAARVDHLNYTSVEAIVDFLHYLINDRRDDYFRWYDNDEERFATDIGFVLGGIDAYMGIGGYRRGETDTRFMGDVYPPGGFSGFRDDINDGSNTIRHLFSAIVFAYDYGDILGNIGGWWRDWGLPWLGNTKDRKLAYIGADLGEELDDVWDPTGWDLDDFDEGVAKRVATPEVYDRLRDKYGW